MVEETAGAEKAAEAKETPEKGSGAAEKDTERIYGQADVDNIVGKVRGGLEEKLSKSQKEIEQLRQKLMTEDEKKAEQLKAEGRQAAESEWGEKAKAWEVEKAILSTPGVDPKMTDDISVLVQNRMKRDGIDDPAQAIASLKESTPALFQGNNKAHPGGGGGRNAPGEEGDELYAADAVARRLREPGGQEWYVKNRERIRTVQRKAAGTNPNWLLKE